MASRQGSMSGRSGKSSSSARASGKKASITGKSPRSSTSSQGKARQNAVPSGSLTRGGANIITPSTILSIVENEKEQEKVAKDAATKTSLESGSETPRPVFEHGVGLTPRLFDTLVHARPAPVEALPSSYLPTISKHVESIAPSKQTFAQYWVPVVFENSVGGRHVMHVDPIVVRTFRRTVAEELQHVREKRKRMLKRIQFIRQEFPQAETRDIAVRLRREIDDAKGRSAEKLLRELPAQVDNHSEVPTSTLHVFLEMTSHMLQLELVCRQLADELPCFLKSAGVQHISFSVLGVESSDNDTLPTLAPFACQDQEAWSKACHWLSTLRSPALGDGSQDSKSDHGLHFANALRWVTTSDAFGDGRKSAVLLLASSKPVDLEACIGLARRSKVPLQMVGIFGLSPEDPEPGLQELADAAAPGSSCRIFFGPMYWSQFISVRERQLCALEESTGESFEGVGAADTLSADIEIVSSKTFELRLIERIMRECYSEEQQCEEELTCATRVFERTLIEREDLLAVLRGSQVPLKPKAPPTAADAYMQRRMQGMQGTQSAHSTESVSY